MKFNCGPSLGERLSAHFDRVEAREARWHDWFAWYPAHLSSDDCRWLETVQRKRHGCLSPWDYLPKVGK